MRFLDLRRVSSSVELKTFLLSTCIDAQESTTNSRSPRLRQESRKYLFFLSEFIDILCQVACVSAGESLLFQNFVLRSFIEFGSPRISLLSLALLHDSRRRTLLFPNICMTHRGLGELDCVI